jgi:hypothetical protein
MKIKRSQLRNLISEAMNSNADEAKQLNEMWMTHGNAFGGMKSLAEAPLEPYMDDPDNLHVHPDDVRMMDDMQLTAKKKATLNDLNRSIHLLAKQALAVQGLVTQLAGEHGELSAIPTAATKVVNDVADVSARFNEASLAISKRLPARPKSVDSAAAELPKTTRRPGWQNRPGGFSEDIPGLDEAKLRAMIKDVLTDTTKK